MPMVPATLQADCVRIFNAMNSMSEGGNEYMASEMAEAVRRFALTGQVATTDTGVAAAGSYAGAGVGTMAIDADGLSDDLLATFKAEHNNDDLADNMAADIDKACSENGIVRTISAGTVTIPAGGTAPFSGPGEGGFTGTRATIATALRTCFASMNNMATGGNEFFAAQFALAVHAYLVAGAISVSLQAPFVSGSGTGRIA